MIESFCSVCLIIFSIQGHVAIVRSLIDNRANINSLNDHGMMVITRYCLFEIYTLIFG